MKQAKIDTLDAIIAAYPFPENARFGWDMPVFESAESLRQTIIDMPEEHINETAFESFIAGYPKAYAEFVKFCNEGR